MDNQQRVISIFLTVGVMCTAAGIYIASCDSTYVRRWREQDVSLRPLGSPETVKANLNTIRVHHPDGKGKFGKIDDLKLELTIEPKIGNFTPASIALLEKQSPTIMFYDDGGTRYGDAKMDLVPVRQDDVLHHFHGQALIANPANLRSAKQWEMFWQLPAKPVVPKPAGQVRGPMPKPATSGM